MRNDCCKKGLVIGIIFLLFVGFSITSNIGGYIGITSNQLTKETSVNFPLDREILAYWKFDEGSGNIAYDSSGNGYDGAITGASWVSGGKRPPSPH